MNATNQTTPHNLVTQTSSYNLDQLVTHMQQVLHNADSAIDKALAETRQLISSANQQLQSIQPHKTTPVTTHHANPTSAADAPVIATRHVDEQVHNSVSNAVQQQSQPENHHLINTMHAAAQQHLANAEAAIQQSISAMNSSISHQAQVLDQQANSVSTAAIQEGQTLTHAHPAQSGHGQTT